MGPAIRILSVSRNADLLVKRNDALALAGFAVVSPRSPVDAPSLAVERKVDVVVIGDSVEQMERGAVISAIRRVRPTAPVIFVYATAEPESEPLADVTVNVAHGDEPLITALKWILSKLD